MYKIERTYGAQENITIFFIMSPVKSFKDEEKNEVNIDLLMEKEVKPIAKEIMDELNKLEIAPIFFELDEQVSPKEEHKKKYKVLFYDYKNVVFRITLGVISMDGKSLSKQVKHVCVEVAIQGKFDN